MQLIKKITLLLPVAAFGVALSVFALTANAGGDGGTDIASCDFEGTVCVSPCEPDADFCTTGDPGDGEEPPACDPPEICESEEVPPCDPEVEDCSVSDGGGEDPSCGVDAVDCFDGNPTDDGGGGDGEVVLECAPDAEICALGSEESAGANDFSGTLGFSAETGPDSGSVSSQQGSATASTSDASSSETAAAESAPARSTFAGGNPDVGTGDTGLLEPAAETTTAQMAILVFLAIATSAVAVVGFTRIR